MSRPIDREHMLQVALVKWCRQAIAPPLVCVAWKDGQSALLKPATAEALRVRLEAEMGPGTHWIVPA